MRRLLLLTFAFAVLLAACDEGGGGVSGPTPSISGSTDPTGSSGGTSATGPTGTPSPSVSPAVRPIPPAWATPIEQDVDPAALPDEALVPPEATLTDRVELPEAGEAPDQVAVSYALGEDPFASEQGFAVWQRFAEAPAWSVVYAFVDAPEEGVLGITLEDGDLTGDGHDDVLVFEGIGGSGACGTWSVVSGTADDTSRIFKRRTCDADLAIRDGGLELREAIYEPDDPHCCPSAFRTTTLEWDGERFAETSVEEEPTST